jgi:hypothetical protein
VRTSSRRFRATWDEQVSCNPCVACGSARPPTAGPILDTRPSYQTTTTIHPVRWPPSLPVCGARARLSPRAAHLPLSVASCEEPCSLVEPAPCSTISSDDQWCGVRPGNRKMSPLYQHLKRYCSSEAKTLASLRAHRAHGLCEKRSTLLLLACLPPRVTTVSNALDFK